MEAKVTATALPIGRAIREATLFLARMHENLWQLIKSLDALMGSQRWSPPNTTMVTGDLGNGLGATSWVARTLWRVYAPSKEMQSDRLQRVSICEFSLAPEDREEAVCLCISAEFRKEVSFLDFWNAWDWTLPSAISALPASSDPVNIPREVLDNGFIPMAARARGATVPLASIENEAGLAKLIVPHLLAKP